MIVCGSEEPLQENNELYSLDVYSGQIRLDGLHNSGANRYVFVWTGSSHDGIGFLTTVIKTVLREVAQSATWVSPWGMPSNASPKAEDHIRKRLEDMHRDRTSEKWDISEDRGMTIARKHVDTTTDLTSDTGFSPANFNGIGWKRLIIAFGNTFPVASAFEEPARAVFEKFAHSGTIAPNDPFVSWLVEHNVNIIYHARELTECLGFACLGPCCLPISDFVNNNIIDQVYANSMAVDAWRIHCD